MQSISAQKDAHAVGCVGIALRIGQRSGAGKENRPCRKKKEVESGHIIAVAKNLAVAKNFCR
jgi:hypothetical protein